MPLDSSDFPVEVQVAFFIFGFLEDSWDGMSGTYLGKKWANIEYLFNLYAIEEPKVILEMMKLYESVIVEQRASEAERKRKAEERRSSSGGGSFTHKVKG